MVSAAGVNVDDAVISVIARSGALSSRMMAASTKEDALELYADASKVPRSSTRALVLHNSGVSIDGDMPIGGAQSAMFFHAFEGGVPKVLKVPRNQTAAMQESALYAALAAGAAAPPAALVPVRFLSLRGSHSRLGMGGDSDSVLLTGGLLMPVYACTLANVPAPYDDGRLLSVLTRLSGALRNIHDAGWLHCDVKPSNIFMDAGGEVWLGDFGSSIQQEEVGRLFRGGTPAFQCADVPCTGSSAFDLACLAVSLLVVRGTLQVGSAPSSGWPVDALRVAMDRVEHAALRTALVALLP